MALAFYDTRARAKRPFEPIEDGKVSIYVCGITVYDRCHVGHARSLVFFDTVVRYLRWRGYEVRFVRNITDIEDKIINRAAERGIEWTALVDQFIGEMHRDVEALGCLQPDIEPRATENIPEMLELIAQLEERGLAYHVGGGDVYFSVGDFGDYGALSGRDLEDLQAGARVDVDSRKRGPMDFALWKGVKPGEPSWPSPWGEGRPGWHLECSAMSVKFLGQPFDIHGGGEDLVFPHHENEMAQTCGASGEEFARYWLHHAFVRVNQEKMAKSIGNVFAIQDVLEKVEAEGLRLHLLSTHYRSPLDFSADGIAESTRHVVRGYEALERAAEAGIGDPGYAWSDEALKPIVEVMDDDFNTVRAVALLLEALREINRALDAGDRDAAKRALGVICTGGRSVGLFQQEPGEFLRAHLERHVAEAGLSVEEVEAAIEARKQARERRDFAAADAVRDDLLEHGIVLLDSPEGTTWKRG